MDPNIAKDLPGILAIVLIFGGGVSIAIIATLAENWRKVRVAEQNAVLKQNMIERGFSADEIVRVIDAGGRPPKACKEPKAQRDSAAVG